MRGPGAGGGGLDTDRDRGKRLVVVPGSGASAGEARTESCSSRSDEATPGTWGEQLSRRGGGVGALEAGGGWGGDAARVVLAPGSHCRGGRRCKAGTPVNTQIMTV